MRQDLQTLNMGLPVLVAPFRCPELSSTGGECHKGHITAVRS
jgi:hypothetical protein